MSFAICESWLYPFDYVSPIDYRPLHPLEAAMKLRTMLTILILATGLVLALSAWAQKNPSTQEQISNFDPWQDFTQPVKQQRPFTQEQVSNMVRAGLAE